MAAADGRSDGADFDLASVMDSNPAAGSVPPKGTVERLREVARDLERAGDNTADMFYGFADFAEEMRLTREAIARQNTKQSDELAQTRELLVECKKLLDRSTSANEAAAARPLMTTRQIRGDVLPTLLAAVKPIQAVIIALLLIGAVGLGYGLHWWNTPPETCDANFKGRRICYRDNGPVLSGVLPASPGSEYPLGLRG